MSQANALIDERTEAALIGAVMVDSACLDRLESVPEPDDFGVPKNAAIWRAALALRLAARQLDEITLTEQLAKTNELAVVGGPAGLMAYDNAVPLSGNAPEYARRVQELAVRRALVARASEIIARAGDSSLDPAIVALEGSGALATAGAKGGGRLKTLKEDYLALLDRLDRIAAGQEVGIVPSGIGIYDEVLGGFHCEYLNGIGAQPSVGKSALMGRMIANLGSRGDKCGVFSLEDKAVWLPKRIVANASGVPVRVLNSQRLHEHQAEAVARAMEGGFSWADNVFVEQGTSLSAAQVAARARQMIAAGAKVIFVDHVGEIQLELGQSERHDIAVTKALTMLRDVAKTTGVPVVPLFHFARPMRSDKEPRYTRPTSTSWANSAGIERMLRVGVGLWLPRPPNPDDDSDEERDYARHYDADEVVCTVLKQTEGDKDIDFTLRMHRPSGLIRNEGGAVRAGTKGYHEETKQ